MRLVKSPEEIALLERAAAIAESAHRDAQRTARPGPVRVRVEAAVDRRFRSMGATGPAYPTIVASGENATILHYVENSRRIAAGDLVLLDAGCEYRGYASDVTRTFPASGASRAPGAGSAGGPRGPARRDRGRQAPAHRGRAARGGAGRPTRRAARPRPPEGPARGAEEEERLPALRAPPHVALARPRRARPRGATATSAAGRGRSSRAWF
ncbi:MAG: M24 family metallopeptidase [Acidobacteria bacterium]|nr:M24 family metallopeptidase [Acidobacteriota bacterium]